MPLRMLASTAFKALRNVLHSCLLTLIALLAYPASTIRELTCKLQTVTAPIAAFVMACLLYTYSVTSIRAAKRNAKLHREADGGQLDMRRESLRRHGVLPQVEGTRGIQLFREASAESQKEKAMMGVKKANELGAEHRGEAETVGAAGARTDVEGRLEEYKGRGNALKRFKEEKPIPKEKEN